MESVNTISGKFKKLWKFYILQSLLAALALFVIVLALGKDNIVLISAMGATSFIVFAMPEAISAQRKNVIGGHLVGLAVGAIFYLVTLPYLIEYPFAVGIAIFLMVVLDLEHPPAAGTALAVAIHEAPFDRMFATIIISVFVLSQCRFYLKGFLRDLV